MLNTVWAVVHEGRIETLGEVDAPEGTRALVTLLVEDGDDFWQVASSESLDEIHSCISFLMASLFLTLSINT